MSEEGNKSLHCISRGCNIYIIWGSFLLFWRNQSYF